MLSENPSMYKNGIHDSCKKKHVHMKRGPIKTERSTLSTSWQAGGQVPGNCQWLTNMFFICDQSITNTTKCAQIRSIGTMDSNEKFQWDCMFGLGKNMPQLRTGCDFLGSRPKQPKVVFDKHLYHPFVFRIKLGLAIWRGAAKFSQTATTDVLFESNWTMFWWLATVCLLHEVKRLAFFLVP